MSKCTECRKSDSLNTWKDTVADWFAHHIVPKTVKNERSAAFTQGYEDGYEKGRVHERELRASSSTSDQRDTKEILERKAINMFSERGYPNMNHVIDITDSGVYLAMEPITKQKASQLRQEALLLKDTYLYEVLQETLRNEAIQCAILNSKEWEHTLAGKSMLLNLSIIKRLVNKLSAINVDAIPENSGAVSKEML